jgi:hypothetical protein
VLEVTAQVLSAVRKAKTSNSLSLRTGVGTLIVTDTQPRIEALRAGERDLREAGKVQDLVMSVGPEAEIEVRLDQGRDAGLTAAAERPT